MFLILGGTDNVTVIGQRLHSKASSGGGPLRFGPRGPATQWGTLIR